MSLQDGVTITAFRRIVGKKLFVQVVASDPLPVAGPVDVLVESLDALPPERPDGSFSWGECWIVAELSHPAFCSARDLVRVSRSIFHL